MNSSEIFALALNIQSPWKINGVKFDENGKQKQLHIDIGYERGAKFTDADGHLCSVHDTQPRRWRHLNFFEHHCYINCRVPRIKTPEGKVKLVQVPWARPQSGFTLLFEGFVMALIESEMPLRKVGRLLGEESHRIWTIFNYWIEKAYAADQPKKVTNLGVDETSRRKGHNYITLAVDLEERRVLHVTEGKDKECIGKISEYMKTKGLMTDDVKHVSMDMSPSFISGAREHFSQAEIHFDRFHVVKLLNEAMDTVRKQERKEHAELKGHKYLFLKNKTKLSDNGEATLDRLVKAFPTLGEAYRLKELFNDFWEQENKQAAYVFLNGWFKQVNDSGIQAFKEFAKTIKAHLSGIVNFCGTRVNNGILEGINCKIQLAKRRARGFKLTKNLINMVYFLCGKLKFDYPLYSS